MAESLPERLRKIANNVKGRSIPGDIVCAIGSGICASPCDKHPEKICEPSCAADALYSIADEIDKCYIERPRFEDGTAVQFGDKVSFGSGIIVCSIAFHASGGFSLQAEDGVWDYYMPGERLESEGE